MQQRNAYWQTNKKKNIILLRINPLLSLVLLYLLWEIKFQTTTVFKSKVDIEVPAELASPITVHLLGSVQYHKTSMSLPVHARYHKPIDGGG